MHHHKSINLNQLILLSKLDHIHYLHIKLSDTEIFENYGKQTMPGEGEYDRPIGTNYTDKVEKNYQKQTLIF